MKNVIIYENVGNVPLYPMRRDIAAPFREENEIYKFFGGVV